MVYFPCRPGHGIFAPESKVRLQSTTMLPQLPANSVAVEGDPPQPEKTSKAASLFSRPPKLGLPGKSFLPVPVEAQGHRSSGGVERIVRSGTEGMRKSASTLFPTDHAPLLKGADLAGSPESDGDVFADRESARMCLRNSETRS